MHEVSYTDKGPDVRWYNYNGHTNEVLKPLFPHEKQAYSSIEEASEAAAKRSELFGNELDKSMERHKGFRGLLDEAAPSRSGPR